MHLNDGEIRTYQDGEASSESIQRIQAHLDTCPKCQARASELEIGSQLVNDRLAMLQVDTYTPTKVTAARPRLEKRILAESKETRTMSNKILSRMPRAAWAGLAIVAILVVALTFAPVRAIANSFLGLFRVEKIQVVQINPGNLPEQLGSSSQFEAILTDGVKIDEKGEPQPVADSTQASAMTGIPIRLPTGMEVSPELIVQPAGSASFVVHLEQVRLLLDEIGRSDIQIPAAVDGATVTMQIPAGVLAQYGKCEFDPETARQNGYALDDNRIPRMPKCTTLFQLPSPTVSAPPGLDLQQLGAAYLQLMGMDAGDAASFAKNVDWATTFVVPLPLYDADYQEVTVDGVTGTLISKTFGSNQSQYLVMWVKDGIVYALTGPGDGATGVDIANSLQ